MTNVVQNKVIVTQPLPIDHKCIAWGDMPYTTPEYFKPLVIEIGVDGTMGFRCLPTKGLEGQVIARVNDDDFVLVTLPNGKRDWQRKSAVAVDIMSGVAVVEGAVAGGR